MHIINGNFSNKLSQVIFCFHFMVLIRTSKVVKSEFNFYTSNVCGWPNGLIQSIEIGGSIQFHGIRTFLQENAKEFNWILKLLTRNFTLKKIINYSKKMNLINPVLIKLDKIVSLKMISFLHF